MGKKRIHELAKELAMTSADLLQRMSELNILPGNKLGPSHSVEDSVAEEIKSKISDLLAASSAKTVIRRRKKFNEEQAPAAEQETVPVKPAARPDFPQADVPAESVESLAAPQPEDAEQAAAPQPSRQGDRGGKKKGSHPKFETATIVGVQSTIRTPDHRGHAKVPSATTPEKAPLPDFLKLSPTRAAAEPTAIAPSADRPSALAVPPPTRLDAPEPLPLSPETPSFAPSGPAGESQLEGAPLQREELSADQRKPESGERVSDSAQSREQGRPGSGREGGAAEGRGRDRPGVDKRKRGGKDSPQRPQEQRRQTTVYINEPAKVIGVAKGFAPSPGGERTEGFVGRQSLMNRTFTAGQPGGPISARTPRPRPAQDGTARPPRPAGAPGAKPGLGGGGRGEAGASQSEGSSRKRGDRRKRSGGGAFQERGAEDKGAARRRELVERTDLYEGAWEKVRSKRPKTKKVQQSKTEITTPKAIKRRIKVDEVITVSELAHRLSLKAGDIIKKLMSLGVMAGLNQSLDFDTATLVAAEFGYDVEKSAFDEGDFLPMPDVTDKYPAIPRSPVVTIMGHVDHGKTSLLDYIRKTKIQEGEAGGITQHIGAYHVKVGDRYITFLDTPGHEAFTAMRSRGAQVTDIVILIVAADDGVMPQTKEAADHAKAAKVPIIVAVNKVDKQGADPDKIRRQMAEMQLTPEEWGGQTVFVDISARTGQGVEDLLEMILLQADILELKARSDGPARGSIIDARLDKGRGAMATVLVGEGLLKLGDSYVCGVHHGKIRAMFTDQGQKIEKVGPSVPVEIQGISGVPLAGDEFIVMEDEKQARQVSQHRLLKQRESVLVKTSKLTLENLFDHIKAGAVKGLNLIIKADVQGSLEAIVDAVQKFSTPEIKISFIHSSIGVVTETDIMLASASNALIICFGVKPPSAKVQDVAESEQVQIRYYDVIYKLLEDIKEAMAGLLDPVKSVKVIGQVEVRAVFFITKVGHIAGCHVTDGRVMRGSRAKLIRGKETVYDGKISSLKREKNDVREVLAGYECGIGLENFSEIREGDRLEIYQIEETAATVAQINEAVERAAAEALKNKAAAEAGAGE